MNVPFLVAIRCRTRDQAPDARFANQIRSSLGYRDTGTDDVRRIAGTHLCAYGRGFYRRLFDPLP
jgi:hypothetical protein